MKPNGNARRAAESRGISIPGAMRRGCTRLGAGSTGRSRWRAWSRTATDFSTCARTCTNGARIGTTRGITRYRRGKIRRGRRGGCEGRRAEERGGIISSTRGARPGAASRRSSGMRIMGSGWGGRGRQAEPPAPPCIVMDDVVSSSLSVGCGCGSDWANAEFSGCAERSQTERKPPGYRQQRQRGPKLDAWIGTIDQILEEDKASARSSDIRPC